MVQSCCLSWEGSRYSQSSGISQAELRSLNLVQRKLLFSFYFERVPSLYIQLVLLQELVHAIKGPQKDRRWERPWTVKDKAYTQYPASQLGVWRILASVNLAILQSFSSFFFFLSHWLPFTKSRSWHHKHTSGTKRFPLNLWLSLVFKAFRVAPFQNQVNICTLPEGRLWGEIQTAL